MAGFWDFLSTLVDSKKDKDGNSVVVKNYISGNNNQKNTTHNHNDRRKLAEAKKPSQSPRGPKTNVTSPVCVSLQCIRLYSTGSKGKVYTDKFYKSINHNFGIEVILKNTSSQAQTIHLGGLSSFLCKFFRKNFMGRGTSPFVELAALKLHLIKAST